MKPYYEQDGIVIFNVDCRDVLPTLEAGSVDLVLTDPPYGIAHPTNYHGRRRDNITACRDYPPVFGDDEPFDPEPILSLNLPTVLWGANCFADRLPTASGWLVWDKERPDTLDQATCELAWTNFVKGVRRFRFLWDGMRRASNEELVHPMQKPIALSKWILSLKWTPSGTVLDPYMGSGSVMRAAKDLGRRAIGIEINQDYCDIAIERLRQQTLPLHCEDIQQRECLCQSTMFSTMAPGTNRNEVG